MIPMTKILPRVRQAAVLMALCTTALRAQTHFQPADTTPDLSRYRTVDECLAATRRVTETARLSLTVWSDTSEYLINEPLDSLPASVISTARQCSAPFRPETVALNAYRDWMKLFLLANRDTEADILMRRGIDSVRQQGHQDSLIGVLYTSMRAYIEARPTRWDKVLSIGLMFEGSDVKPSGRQLLGAYIMQFDAAEGVNDTATRRRFAEKIVAAANALPAEQKAEAWYGSTRYRVTAALDFLSHLALMDSLRHSSTAYVALKRANWETVRGKNRDPLPAFVGKQAVPVVADFWFAPDRGPLAAGETPSRPTRGKVALVIFLRGCRAETSIFNEPVQRQSYRGDCWEQYAIMHRFAQRFPNLEMTLVAQTSGYLGESSPVTSQAEADILQKWWLGFHRLPATLAVATTPFFRLDPPDRRRIDEPVENAVNYLFGEGQKMFPRVGYLVDKDGMVLYSGYFGRQTERYLREILDVVMRR